MEIQIALPGVKLGIIEADGARVEASGEELAHLIHEACARKQREFTLTTLAEAEAVRAVRAMFRAWGMDPSKYRPSSEALLRRVVQGKGLYFISNIVDLVNLGSIETAWPYGCYDRAKVHPRVVFRHGQAGESYERVGKEMWHLEGRPALADAQGPFGAPISDSTRTMITDATRDVLIVVYAPAASLDSGVKDASQSVADRLSRFAHAAATRISFCGPSETT